MMGNQSGVQASLFYAFNLEDHVPQDHLLRSIDRFIDLADIRRHLAPFYSSIGRPSIDPELMIRMLLVGYIMGIRSERRLSACPFLKARITSNPLMVAYAVFIVLNPRTGLINCFNLP